MQRRQLMHEKFLKSSPPHSLCMKMQLFVTLCLNIGDVGSLLYSVGVKNFNGPFHSKYSFILYLFGHAIEARFVKEIQRRGEFFKYIYKKKCTY